MAIPQIQFNAGVTPQIDTDGFAKAAALRSAAAQSLVTPVQTALQKVQQNNTDNVLQRLQQIRTLNDWQNQDTQAELEALQANAPLGMLDRNAIGNAMAKAPADILARQTTDDKLGDYANQGLFLQNMIDGDIPNATVTAGTLNNPDNLVDAYKLLRDTAKGDLDNQGKVLSNRNTELTNVGLAMKNNGTHPDQLLKRLSGSGSGSGGDGGGSFEAITKLDQEFASNNNQLANYKGQLASLEKELLAPQMSIRQADGSYAVDPSHVARQAQYDQLKNNIQQLEQRNGIIRGQRETIAAAGIGLSNSPVNNTLGGNGYNYDVANTTGSVPLGSSGYNVQPIRESSRKAMQSLLPSISKHASRVGLMPELMAKVLDQESGFNHSARSKAGAVGVAQIMPATAGDPGFGVTPVRNNSVEEALRFNADYLQAMITEFRNDPVLGVAAYNAGHANIKRMLRTGNLGGFGETRDYTKRILGIDLADHIMQLRGQGVTRFSQLRPNDPNGMITAEREQNPMSAAGGAIYGENVSTQFNTPTNNASFKLPPKYAPQGSEITFTKMPANLQQVFDQEVEAVKINAVTAYNTQQAANNAGKPTANFKRDFVENGWGMYGTDHSRKVTIHDAMIKHPLYKKRGEYGIPDDVFLAAGEEAFRNIQDKTKGSLSPTMWTVKNAAPYIADAVQLETNKFTGKLQTLMNQDIQRIATSMSQQYNGDNTAVPWATRVLADNAKFDVKGGRTHAEWRKEFLDEINGNDEKVESKSSPKKAEKVATKSEPKTQTARAVQSAAKPTPAMAAKMGNGIVNADARKELMKRLANQ